MCFGSSDSANAAAQQAAQQQAEMNAQNKQRKSDISAGQTAIDNAFRQFNPGYYQHYGDTYKKFYDGQLDYQYGKGVDAASGGLAANGMLESSVGASKLADLFKKFNDTRAQIANQSVDAQGQLKGQVQQAKTQLYNANAAAADPAGAAAQASGSAGAIAAPTSYSPLGDVFGGLVSSVGNAARGSMYGNYFTPSASTGLASGSGSGRAY